MSEAHVKAAPVGASASQRGEQLQAVTVLLAAHPRRSGGANGLRSTLEGEGFELVAQASDSRGAVREALAHEPQVCLVDAGLPGGVTGAVTAVVAHLPDTRIGVLAESPDDERAARAIHAGADGVLITHASPEALRADIQLFARDELPLPQGLVSARLSELGEPELVAEPREHSRVVSALLYPPRFSRHLWRRVRSGMSLSVAWTSARDRMTEYW